MPRENEGPTDDIRFDSSRAELFDALGHPTRIKILQALNQQAMSFSELKKQVGIESSGHLSFHIGKLGSLVRTTPEGAYELTDDGREAFHLAEVMSTTGSATSAADSIQKGRDARNRILPHSNPRKRKRIVLVAAVVIVALLVLGIGLSDGFIYYSSQQTLNWSYQFYPGGWQTVAFNDTQGKFFTDFNFWPIGYPVTTNSTAQTTDLMVQIAHSQGTHLDSLQLQFVPDNPSGCNCFLLEEVTSGGIGGSPPVSSRMYTQNHATTFTVSNFGYIGIASVSMDFLLFFARANNDAVPSSNNSVIMNIQMKLHSDNAFLIGKDYVGDASVRLNITPTGTVSVANTTASGIV